MPTRPNTDGLIIYCDGLCYPADHGVATWGWVAMFGGKVLVQRAGYITEGAEATSNRAEYWAFLHAVGWLWLTERRTKPVTIHSDCEILIKQLKGEYKVGLNSPLKDMHARAIRGLAGLSKAQISWIPWEENKLADDMTAEAFNLHVLEHGEECIGFTYQRKEKRYK